MMSSLLSMMSSCAVGLIGSAALMNMYGHSCTCPYPNTEETLQAQLLSQFPRGGQYRQEMTQYDVSAKFQCKNASLTSSLEILPPCLASGGQMHHVSRYCFGFSIDSILISVLIIVLAYVWTGRGSRRSSKFFAQLLLRKSVKELVGVFRQPHHHVQTPPHLLYCHYRNMSKIHALQLPGTVSH